MGNRRPDGDAMRVGVARWVPRRRRRDTLGKGVLTRGEPEGLSGMLGAPSVSRACGYVRWQGLRHAHRLELLAVTQVE